MRDIIRIFREIPNSLKAIYLVLALIFIGAVLVVAVIPMAILVFAYPKFWIVSGILAILLIIGYIKGRCQ